MCPVKPVDKVVTAIPVDNVGELRERRPRGSHPWVPTPLGTWVPRYPAPWVPREAGTYPMGSLAPRELGVRWVGRGSRLCAVRRTVRGGVLSGLEGQDSTVSGAPNVHLEHTRRRSVPAHGETAAHENDRVCLPLQAVAGPIIMIGG